MSSGMVKDETERDVKRKTHLKPDAKSVPDNSELIYFFNLPYLFETI